MKESVGRGALGWMSQSATRCLAWLSGGERSAEAAEELPRAFPVFLLLFGVGMILISLVGDQGLISYYRLQTEASDLRQEVGQLQQRERALLQEIKALRSDPAYIEMLAHQRLGLVHPDETVIQLPPTP
jgi:cell division protein FtsB